MTWTIGIFEREQQVLDAARELRALAGESRSLIAVVDNEENVPLLSSQDEIPLEGVAGLQAAADESNGAFWPDEDREIPAVAYLNSVQGAGVNGQAAAFAAYALSESDEVSTTEGLVRLGLSSSAARTCAPSVEEGKLLLLADVASLEEAARLMRSFGASDVVQ